MVEWLNGKMVKWSNGKMVKWLMVKRNNKSKIKNQKSTIKSKI